VVKNSTANKGNEIMATMADKFIEEEPHQGIRSVPE
jgi:hypothetical protein